jgi:hypothetical protein
MANLLDTFLGNPDQTQALGLLGAGMMNGGFSRGAPMAMQYLSEAPQRRRQGLLQEMQMAEAQQKMEDAQRQRQFMQNLPEGGNPMLRQAAMAGVISPADYIKSTLPKGLEFGKINPGDYTPESLQAAQATGDHTKLVPVRKLELGPGGQAYNPWMIQPGTVMNDPQKPFMIGPGGALVPNQPVQDYQLRKARAGASNVSVTTKQETEEAKSVGKFFGDNYADVQKSGLTAQSSINRIDRLGQLLDGVDTGKFAPLGVEVAKGAQAFGLNIDPKLSNKEAAIALSSEMALQLRNPYGGAGMPGAMSDADRNFLAGMVPGIEKTPEGRKAIMQTARKLAQRDMEVARMARTYRQKNGSINEGFYDELARHSEANPLFGGASPRAGQAAANPAIDDLVKKYAR